MQEDHLEPWRQKKGKMKGKKAAFSFYLIALDYSSKICDSFLDYSKRSSSE